MDPARRGHDRSAGAAASGSDAANAGSAPQPAAFAQPEPLSAVVIGAGQAGLSTSYHLARLGIEHVVIDQDPAPGGAWGHRWDALTMRDVHGVAELPGSEPPPRTSERANRAVPAYFARYEREHGLPVVRPVHVRMVRNDEAAEDGGLAETPADPAPLLVSAAMPSGAPAGAIAPFAAPGRGSLGDAMRFEIRARTIVNATGTWTRPFIPHSPGAEEFLGEQFHTAQYPGPQHFVGKRTLIVGGGASAVQFLGALAPITETVWVTRREPVWRTDDFTSAAGIEAVAMVERRVAAGLPPESVVSVTGLMLREQEREAERLGAYAARRPMFARLTPEGAEWPDGSRERFDAILWATGFRPAIAHLAPLRLRTAEGGIRLDRAGRGTTAVADPRVQLVGYGPSASTIGANRAGRSAANGVRRFLEANPHGSAA